MVTKKQMLERMNERDPEGLSGLWEAAGFDIEIDPKEALEPHTQRIREFYVDGDEIRHRVTGHNMNTMQFWYEDLNNHAQSYLNGFVRQRRSNGCIETSRIWHCR